RGSRVNGMTARTTSPRRSSSRILRLEVEAFRTVWTAHGRTPVAASRREKKLLDLRVRSSYGRNCPHRYENDKAIFHSDLLLLLVFGSGALELATVADDRVWTFVVHNGHATGASRHLRCD